MSLSEILMTTFSGATINLLDPKPEDIVLEDITWGLSKLCRFSGQCSKFYSVAEHSVMVGAEVLQSGEASRVSNNYRWALLHDAAEAYIGDMIGPLKHHPALGAFVAIETRLLGAIARRFGLGFPVPELVVRADRTLLDLERLELQNKKRRAWALQCYDHDMAYGLFWEAAKKAGLK